MYLPALLEMAIEEDGAGSGGDEQTGRGGDGRGSEGGDRSSTGGGATDTRSNRGSSGAAHHYENNGAVANSVAVSGASSDPEAIETLVTDVATDLCEGEGEGEESEPLQAANNKPNLDTDDSRELSGETKVSIEDDGDSPSHKQKKWDKKCGIIGVLLLLVILCGAVAGILMNKFAAKPMYQFQFAEYYADHMVLQRAPSKAVVWGYGPVTDDNRTITLKLEGPMEVQEHTVHITNEVSGSVWRVILDAVTDKGPYTLTASLDQQPEKITLRDIMFGDVWVCGGQTNMQYSMDRLQEETEEDEFAELDKYQDVRIMTVGSQKSNIPWYDIRIVQLPWSLPSKEKLASKRVPQSQFSSHFPAVCWLYGKQLYDKLHYPVGLISTTYSASALEDWVSHDVITKCNINVAHATSMVYNAMLHPLLSLSFYGMIWYQGETDALQTSGRFSGRYNCTMVNMITDLREKLYNGTWGSTDPNLPFGFVQLAPNREGEKYTFGFTEIRWQQTGNYGYVPNDKMSKTFMAVAIDLPDVNSTYRSIHSRYKHDIADRLTLGALAVAYQQRDIVFTGPRLTKYAVHRGNNSMVLHTDASYLDVRDTGGFEVCCSENRTLTCLASGYISASFAPGREWLQAPIERGLAQSVVITFPQCKNKHPVAIRYLWRETPCELHKCALYDKASRLPMAPFINMKLNDDSRWHNFPTEQVDLNPPLSR